MEVWMTIYDPGYDPVTDTFSINKLEIRPAGEVADYFSFLGYEYTRELLGSSGPWVHKLKARIVLNENIKTTTFALEFVVGNAVGESVWPYLDSCLEEFGGKYWINSTLGQDLPSPPPDGYRSIQYAVGQLLPNNHGSEATSIILKLAPGEYSVSQANPITLPEGYCIEGTSPDECIISLDASATSNGFFLFPGLHSQISNCTIRCGTKVEHSNVRFKNCIFEEVQPVAQENVTAVEIQGWHHVVFNNCIFNHCNKAMKVGLDSVASITDCNFVECAQGLEFDSLVTQEISSFSMGFIKNSIFAHNSSDMIAVDALSRVVVLNSCFYDNQEDFNVSENGRFQERGNQFDTDPLFVDYQNGDFHLQQPNISKSCSNVSPCVNSGRSGVSNTTKSTSPDGVVDRDQYDIGYHYPAVTEFKYVVAQYKGYNSGFNTRWDSEVAIQNPNSFEIDVNLKYYVSSTGTFVSESDYTLNPHETKQILLGPGSSPTSIGNIVIESTGPLFGQCLQKYSTSLYTRSFMTQIQRVDYSSDELSSTSLCTGNWSAHFGGGNNVASTEFVVTNYHDEPVIVTAGRFFNPNGVELMNAHIYAFTLQPHRTYSVTKSAGFALTWGSFEVTASHPLVGEMIITSRNPGTLAYSSEGVIMLPKSMFSDKLIASKVQSSDDGDQSYEDYIIIKNTDDLVSAPVNIELYNTDGSSVVPDPYPNTIGIGPNSLFTIDVWDILGTSFLGSAEITTTDGTKVLIGHSESIGYNQPANRIQIAGSEMDPMLANNTKYFVPYCRTIANGTTEIEETWSVLKNVSETATDISILAYNLAGNLVDAPVHPVLLTPSFELAAHEIVPICLPSGEQVSIKSLEINSSQPISGWVERANLTSASKMWYDSILMQTW